MGSKKRFPSPVHPGQFLEEEFLHPLGISSRNLAKKIHLPPERMDKLIGGRERITSNLACRLSEVLDTHPEMWIRLQHSYDRAQGKNSPKNSKQASSKQENSNKKSPPISERPVNRHEES